MKFQVAHPYMFTCANVTSFDAQILLLDKQNGYTTIQTITHSLAMQLVNCSVNMYTRSTLLYGESFLP